MKVFRKEATAQSSYDNHVPIWLNGYCPIIKGNLIKVAALEVPVEKFCGNWCALFHAFKDDNGKIKFVILGCKGTDKHLYVEDIEYED